MYHLIDYDICSKMIDRIIDNYSKKEKSLKNEYRKSRAIINIIKISKDKERLLEKYKNHLTDIDID